MGFHPLHVKTNQEGEGRKSGFEFEFGNLGVKEAAAITQSVYGGEIEEKSRFEFTCKTELGTFDIVLDAKPLTDLKHRKLLADIGIDLSKIDHDDVLETLIEKGASLIVPCEITTPPLPFEKLQSLETLADALVKAGAKGTGGNLHYAFGLHINLEVPDLEANTLLAYIQSYLLLEEHIKAISHIDLTRRLSAFIDPFPKEYIKEALDPQFAPSLETLMKHYFKHNPTRNRALDMTPIFGTIDKALTRASIKEPQLLKPRPALHYRLPNCSLGEKNWSVATEWNRFMLVEALANKPEKRRWLLEQFASIEEEHFFGKKSKRNDALKEILSDLS